MNNPISEQEFDELLSKRGKNDNVSEKSLSPISLDEFDKMIDEKQQPEMNWRQQLFNAMQQASSNVPKFVENHQLNKENINDFIEKSLGGIGMEGPALGRGLVKGAKYLGEKLSPSFAKFTGKEAAGKAENVIENLLGENKLSEYHKPILSKVRENYTKNLKSGSKEYEAIKELAKNEGYKGQSQLSRALGEKNAKSINDSILNKLDDLNIEKKSSLGQALENFRRQPSFNAAHELQSELGKEGASKIKSLDSAEASLGRSLMDARKGLISDIEKTFKSNKDMDLLNRYKKATQHWYKNVRPYLENNTIKNIVTKKGIQEINPTNLDTLLSKADESVEHVLSKLPQEYKDLILAKKLSPAINESGLHGRQVNPQALVKKFNQLKNTPYEKFITPEHTNAITDLEKSLKFSGKYGPIAKNVGTKAAVGTLSGLGISKLLKELGVY